jgi:hypothetical protein
MTAPRAAQKTVATVSVGSTRKRKAEDDESGFLKCLLPNKLFFSVVDHVCVLAAEQEQNEVEEEEQDQNSIRDQAEVDSVDVNVHL